MEYWFKKLGNRGDLIDVILTYGITSINNITLLIKSSSNC